MKKKEKKKSGFDAGKCYFDIVGFESFTVMQM